MSPKSEFHYGFPSFAYDGSKSHIARQLIEFFPPTGRLFIDVFSGRGNLFWALATLDPNRFERYALNDFRTGTFLEALQTHGDKIQLLTDLDEVGREFTRIRLKLVGLGDNLAALLPEEKVLEPYLSFGGRGYHSGGPAKRISPEAYKRTVLGAQKILLDLKPHITTYPWEKLNLWELTWDDCLYLDPPYYGCSVNSYDPWDIEEHKRLISFLKFAPCKWVLSEYRQSMYVKAFGEPREIPTRCNVGNQKKELSERKECVWTNFD